MVLTGVSLAFVLVLSSVVAVLSALYLAVWLGPESRRLRQAVPPGETDENCAIFLFDQTNLVDATTAGERLLAAAPSEGSEWSRLLRLLAPDFSDLEERISQLSTDTSQSFQSNDGTTHLTAEWQDGLSRIKLTDEDLGNRSAKIDVQSLGALERELHTLRSTTDAGPCLVWHQDSDGRLTWMNEKYIDLLKRLQGSDAVKKWPTPALFDVVAVNESASHDKPLRAALQCGQTEHWFDVYTTKNEDDLICTAVNIDAAVGSELQLRAFTQTLSKTFADLAIGLAIFDRARRLVIFNPALTELTELSFGFLAAHPTLNSFLDRLRDQGRIPEPRNYVEWRKTMAELEHSASDGNYSETWTLPSGQTLRVTGRPHPDGALAFVFEDISAEISLTRRFRTELEVGRSVFDHFEEAVAVFSSSGTLTMANQAYSSLWGHTPLNEIVDVSVADVANIWRDKALPSPVWNQCERYVRASGSRTPWHTEITLRDGRAVSCRFVPLSGGATLVGFSPNVASAGSLQFKRRAG